MLKSIQDEILENPSIGDTIAMGIRWLSYKYSTIPKNNDKNLFNTLRGYYDWQKGKPYAEKVLDLYNKSLRK